MAAKRRQCVNCWFYRSADMSGYGWCVHPDRQQESSARLMVRNRELACRNSWGNDLFLHKDTDTPPLSPSTSQPPHLANASGSDEIDDEVTSVVTPRSPGAPLPSTSEDSEEDRVVSDRPSSRPEDRAESDDGLNDAARLDQEERARVMARGSGDAIASARARYFERRRQGRSTPQPTDSTDVLPAAGESANPVAANGKDSPRDSSRVVSQQERLSHRFTRHKPSETFEASREEPVPRSEVEQHHNDSRDRFDSVPEIDPNFDLPGVRRNDVNTAPDSDVPPSRPVEVIDEVEAEPAAEPPSETDIDEIIDELPIKTYEHVLNRARRIRETRKAPRSRSYSVAAHLADVDVPDQDDAAPDGYWRDDDLTSPNTTDEYPAVDDKHQQDHVDATYRRQHPGSAQGDRRRSWLERFSGHRDRDQRQDTPGIADQAAIGSPHDQVEPLANDASAYLDHHAAVDDWEDEPALAMNARPDDVDDWHDPDQSSFQPFDDAVWDDEADQQAYLHLDAPAMQHGHHDLATLPDIDDLFAAPEPDRHHTRNAAASAGWTPPPTAAAGMATTEEPRAGLGRWSADAPYTPRDSFFRSRRYKDWQATESAPDTVEAEPADYDDVYHDEPSAPHQRDQRGQLPDLDASSFDLKDVISRGSELLDMTIDIAPDIPRECRTCRSFRTADGGARGWCTNEWAFTHRRMVNEDDLACETTIGSWWLPDDRYWMPEDETTWDDATPRMNAFLRRFATTRKRKISGE